MRPLADPEQFVVRIALLEHRFRFRLAAGPGDHDVSVGFNLKQRHGAPSLSGERNRETSLTVWALYPRTQAKKKPRDGDPWASEGDGVFNSNYAAAEPSIGRSRASPRMTSGVRMYFFPGSKSGSSYITSNIDSSTT